MAAVAPKQATLATGGIAAGAAGARGIAEIAAGAGIAAAIGAETGGLRSATRRAHARIATGATTIRTNSSAADGGADD